MPRILLLQLKRIGDVILTAPAVAALREALPDAELVMVCASGAAAVARLMPELDRVVEYRTGKLNPKAWSAAVAGPWDACLDFTGTDRAALLMGLSRARRRIAYAKHARNAVRRVAANELCGASVRELHTVDFHLALVETLTGKPAASVPRLLVPQAAKDRARLLIESQGATGDFAIVHPGTAREDKFWPDERWAEVISVLQKKHRLPVVLTGSGDGLEAPHLAALKKLLAAPVIDLTGRLSLGELAALIADCRIILGVDSMAMHLASVLKKPQVALFGPTNPFHWRPLHSRALVMVPGEAEPLKVFQPLAPKRDMKHLSTDAVLNAMERLLRQSS